jgi:mono/diheme cytochrome c family protein
MAAAREMGNPHASNESREAVHARGRRLFVMTCQACHGLDGAGNAPVVPFGVGAPAIDTAVARDKYTDGELFHIITHGINTMPAHASHVEYDDRWKLVTYLRSLQADK